MLAGLTDPWIALLVPWMVLFPVGIALGGSPLASLVALLAGLLLLLAFLALESCVGTSSRSTSTAAAARSCPSSCC